VEQIRTKLSAVKYLPLLKLEMAMSVNEGPVGEIDSAKLRTKNLSRYLDEALEQGVDKNPQAKLILDQAACVLKVRKCWKLQQWDHVLVAVSSTILPSPHDLISTEVSWATLESQDRTFQKDMEDALDIGVMDPASGKVEYDG
jgi:hypothetical protein